MIDVEADFWKEHFVHLLHKNMVRTNAQVLHLSEAPAEFERFQTIHPECKVEIQNSSSYVTWEVFITPSLKLRLFIQNQIKATLLQKNGKDLVKIADSKFPYNPFPEISEFLNNKDSYLVELSRKKEEFSRNQRKLKLAGEFIKALLEKKFSEKKDVMWNIELLENGYKLNLTKNGSDSTYIITPENYSEVIRDL